MEEKQKWEEKYEIYKILLKDATEESIGQVLKGKQSEYARKLASIVDVDSEEYRKILSEKRKSEKEYRNLSKTYKIIAENLPEIERIKGHRDRRQELLKELLNRQKKRAELDKKAKELDEELKDIIEMKGYCNNALSNPNATKEQKEHASRVLKEYNKKFEQNQEQFSEVQGGLKQKLENSKWDTSKDVIELLGKQIDIDNRMCEQLLEGKTMAEISLGIPKKDEEEIKAGSKIMLMLNEKQKERQKNDLSQQQEPQQQEPQQQEPQQQEPQQQEPQQQEPQQQEPQLSDVPENMRNRLNSVRLTFESGYPEYEVSYNDKNGVPQFTIISDIDPRPMTMKEKQVYKKSIDPNYKRDLLGVDVGIIGALRELDEQNGGTSQLGYQYLYYLRDLIRNDKEKGENDIDIVYDLSDIKDSELSLRDRLTISRIAAKSQRLGTAEYIPAPNKIRDFFRGFKQKVLPEGNFEKVGNYAIDDLVDEKGFDMNVFLKQQEQAKGSELTEEEKENFMARYNENKENAWKEELKVDTEPLPQQRQTQNGEVQEKEEETR